MYKILIIEDDLTMATASGAEFAADGRQILEEEKASDKEVHISEE